MYFFLACCYFISNYYFHNFNIREQSICFKRSHCLINNFETVLILETRTNEIQRNLFFWTVHAAIVDKFRGKSAIKNFFLSLYEDIFFLLIELRELVQ